MDAAFCGAALTEALARYGKPEIFNTDQGSRVTGSDFACILATARIEISMDVRFMDNVFQDLAQDRAAVRRTRTSLSMVTPMAVPPKTASPWGWNSPKAAAFVGRLHRALASGAWGDRPKMP